MSSDILKISVNNPLNNESVVDYKDECESVIYDEWLEDFYFDKYSYKEVRCVFSNLEYMVPDGDEGYEPIEYIDDYMEEYDLGGYKIKYLSNQPNDLEGGFFYVVIKFRIIVNDVEVILIIDYYDCSDTDCTFSYDTNTNITEDLIYKEIYNIHQRWLPVKEAYGTWNRIKNSA